MAICIPETDKDFETPGERKFFKLLRTLPDSCLVYYEMQIGERDRRPDFVVIDIEKGITIFEVKDWGIDTIKNANRLSFTIYTKQNRTRGVQNPDRKIKKYIEDVRETLTTQEILCDARDRLGFEINAYIVFPNMTQKEFSEKKLGQIIPEDLVLFSDNLKSSEMFLNFYSNNRGSLQTNISHQKLDAIRMALFPELKIPSGEQWFRSEKSDGPVVTIADDSYEFGLDIGQEQIAKSLGSGPRFLHGIAGTGKTLILLFHAKLTSANNIALDKPPKILVLCWNISLAQYMRHAYNVIDIPDAADVEIIHFAGFARKLIRSTPGVYFPRPGDSEFDAKITGALDKVNVRPNQKYDIVYIDEVQDFQQDWIKFIYENLLNDFQSGRNLVLSGDDAQHIYKYRDVRASDSWKSIGIDMRGRGKVLKKIYRNSARVWAFAAAFMGGINQFYKDDSTKIEFAPKRGFDPQLFECDTIEEQLDKAVDIVSRLAEHGYSLRNAMILYRSKNVKGVPIIESLVSKLESKKIPCQWITEDNEQKANFNWSEESVKISTVHSAKGMDAPVVIILTAEEFRTRDTSSDDEEKILYVALTRAREVLWVLYSGNSGMVPRLQDAMKEYKKYRKQILELEERANTHFLR